jgi:hypothetical protein
MHIRHIFYLILVVICSSCASKSDDLHKTELKIPKVESKINGVSLEMPSGAMNKNELAKVKRSNSEWIAIIPYAYSKENEAAVHYNYDGQWRGEGIEGTYECAQMAQELGLKMMLKPHVWVVGQGWPGNFDLGSEKEWLEWEKTYREYILEYAKIADSMKIDLYSIGTEYRIAVVKRPCFWEKLIDEVREIYKGKVTYASNWDNYKKVGFWSKLDYIGVDAYFPLSNTANPTLKELKRAWKPIEADLALLSIKESKPILFTEYGYKSVEHATTRQGLHEESSLKTSPDNQQLAYEALFETIWSQDFMAGGFFWKWHLYSDETIGGETNRRFTPQGKRAEKTIAKWYKRKP